MANLACRRVNGLDWPVTLFGPFHAAVLGVGIGRLTGLRVCSGLGVAGVLASSAYQSAIASECVGR